LIIIIIVVFMFFILDVKGFIDDEEVECRPQPNEFDVI